MSNILEEVKKMVYESKSHHNDGWVMKGYKDKLKEIYYYIENELHLRHAETDGLEVGSPEDYDLDTENSTENSNLKLAIKGFTKEQINSKSDKYIYESPDGGETIYRRKMNDVGRSYSPPSDREKVK